MTRLRAITEQNRKWWTLGAMCFALFMIMLDNTVVNVALPSIQRTSARRCPALEWTINAYTLTFAVLLVTGGRLGDIFGRRRAFLFGVVRVRRLSSATAGLAPNEAWLVASRAVQGIGAAFDDAGDALDHHQRLPGARARQGDRHLGRRVGARARDRARGRWLAHRAGQLARDLLPEPARRGARGDRDARRGARSRATRPSPRTVDYAGVGAITVGIGALVLALVEGNDWGWGSPRDHRPARASRSLGLVAFVVVERAVRYPMVEFAFLRSRTFVGTNGIAFVVSFSMLAMFFFMALYMQNILGYSPLEAGIRFLPSTVVIIVTAPIAGPAHGPDRRERADRGRACRWSRSRSTCSRASPSTPATATSSPPSSLMGLGIGLDDVADVDRRDERGRGDEGRRRVGHPLDEPHGRRHLRRRGRRRAVPAR